MDDLLDFVIGNGILSFASYLIFFDDLMLGMCLGIVGLCVVARSLRSTK